MADKRATNEDDTVGRLVDRLLEDVADEYRQYLKLLVSAWLQRNDCDPDDMELVVDTYDPERIVLYPRVKSVQPILVGPPQFPYCGPRQTRILER